MTEKEAFMHISKTAMIAGALTMLCMLSACKKEGDASNSMFHEASSAAATQDNTQDAVSAVQKYTEVGNDEALAMAYEMTGIDIAPFSKTAGGLTKNGIAYISIPLQQGKEDEIEAVISDKFGECVEDKEEMILPAMGVNRIFDAINNADTCRRYQYVRQGENGAKTKTTDIFITKTGDNTVVYILGSVSASNN